jgi:hypothetical protein
MASLKNFLPIFTVALIIVNLWSMLSLEEIVNRWILFGTMLSFFFLFISPWYYNKRGLLLFVLLLLSDALLIFYEVPVFNALIFLVRIASYLALVWIVLNKLRNLRTNLFQKVSFAFAVLLNIFLLYSLVEMVPDGDYNYFFDFLFYLYGLSVIICVTAAVSYSNRYANRPSIFFLLAVLGLAFSDLTYFIGFNLSFHEFFFANRIFNILGIGALLHFMNLDRSLSKEDAGNLVDK